MQKIKSMNSMIKDIEKLIGLDQQEAEVEEIETNLQDNEEKINYIRKISNIPKRYINAKYEPKSSSQALLLKTLENAFKGQNLNAISDILIMGSVGTGKTYLICSFLQKIINAGIYCRYATEYHLLDLFFQKNYQEFENFKKVDILAIDELGKRELQDWQMIQIEELISYRYNEMLPTIYITNMNSQDFKRFVGDRVADRLRDNRVVRVNLNGESLRGKQNG